MGRTGRLVGLYKSNGNGGGRDQTLISKRCWSTQAHSLIRSSYSDLPLSHHADTAQPCRHSTTVVLTSKSPSTNTDKPNNPPLFSPLSSKKSPAPRSKSSPTPRPPLSTKNHPSRQYQLPNPQTQSRARGIIMIISSG